jgi:hypothetical protein
VKMPASRFRIDDNMPTWVAQTRAGFLEAK